MTSRSPEVSAARRLAASLDPLLERSTAFRQLDAPTRAAILGDLRTIRRALEPDGAPSGDPYSLALETPDDFRRRIALARQGTRPTSPAAPPASADAPIAAPTTRAATDTIAARAGALSDEIDFPAFVASLVHGTFDAIVDATIRQMEAFADLVSQVAKTVDQFTRDNVTINQVRDYLAERYPRDLALELPAGGAAQPRLLPRLSGDGEEVPSPEWLADYGLAGEPLTEELVEEALIPAARRTIGESRLQMLATMVLLGMSRINIRDGSIAAKVRFRAAARDKAIVDYATSADAGRPGWGTRASSTYAPPSTMISTVGVNVQAESDLKVELFGEVKINFVSETLPLERFVDPARLALLQGNARWSAAAPGSAAPAPAPAATTPPLATTPPTVDGVGGAAPIAPATPPAGGER